MSTVLDCTSPSDQHVEILHQAEEAGVDLARLPRHIAIIMDGNGRWARSMKRPRIEGHRAGIRAVRDIVRACRRLEIPYLTLYAFSAENWKRPGAEINALMVLLCNFLRRETKDMLENGIRLESIGDAKALPAPVQAALDAARRKTEAGDKLQLTLALSYGGRQEILDAVQSIVKKVQSGQMSLEEITSERFSRELDTGAMPDPDLLIRTSGEMRVSNFLLWQIAYSEIWITPTLWPDFSQRELFIALRDFQGRHRRFGGVDIDGGL